VTIARSRFARRTPACVGLRPEHRQIVSELPREGPHQRAWRRGPPACRRSTATFIALRSRAGLDDDAIAALRVPPTPVGCGWW
jgi:hypothetical protein